MNNGPERMDEEREGAEPVLRPETASGVDSIADAVPYLLPEQEPSAEDAETLVLERELRAALKPVELPAGFADRVLAASALTARGAAEVKTPAAAKVMPFRSRFGTAFQAYGSWRLAAGGAIAACLLAGSFVMEEIHQRHEQERAQVTAQQLETAVAVSNHALDEARAQLARAAFRMDR